MTAALAVPPHGYRAGIDGLRALAVVPVILYHAGVSELPGGFVGVDIFFVISGFLITRILLSDIAIGRYSLLKFYDRRARRILPAFTVMVLATVCVASVIMLPSDLASLGSSAVAATLFVSNILFWLESSDYFGVVAENKPLLHTWSLAVEEQFYILFPLLLALVSKFAGRLVLFACCAAVAILSFALSVWGTTFASMATFYLLPTRAWELLAGSLLAFGLLPRPGRRVAEVTSLFGLLLLLYSILCYRADIDFPGLAAVPPVAGALFILYAGEGCREVFVERVLSNPAIRFVGLISYSLYLWHWPILVLGRYYFLDLTPPLVAGLLIVITIVSALSWRFVERPFRTPGQIGGSAVAGAAVAAMLLLCAAGVTLVMTRGLPTRVPADVLLTADKRTHQGPARECGSAFASRRTGADLCLRGAPDASKPTFLIVGDSHADALAAAIVEAATSVGQAGFQITDTGYRPVLGFEKLGEAEKYRELNKLTVELLDTHPSVRTVMVPIYWYQATAIDTYWDESGRRVRGTEAVGKGLAALALRYPEHRFLVVDSAAHSPLFGGAVAARAKWYGRNDFVPEIPRSTFERERGGYKSVVGELSRIPNVTILELALSLCDESVCKGHYNGQPAYTDDNHLSYAASRAFIQQFSDFLILRD